MNLNALIREDRLTRRAREVVHASFAIRYQIKRLGHPETCGIYDGFECTCDMGVVLDILNIAVENFARHRLDAPELNGGNDVSNV